MGAKVWNVHLVGFCNLENGLARLYRKFTIVDLDPVGRLSGLHAGTSSPSTCDPLPLPSSEASPK